MTMNLKRRLQDGVAFGAGLWLVFASGGMTLAQGVVQPVDLVSTTVEVPAPIPLTAEQQALKDALEGTGPSAAPMLAHYAAHDWAPLWSDVRT